MSSVNRTMRPFQRASYCASNTVSSPGKFLLASGPSIISFRSDTGEFLSDWMIGDEPDETVEEEHSDNGPEDPISRPHKKRKLLNQAGTGSDDSSAEIVIENGKNVKPRRRKKINLASVTNLCSTQDVRYVVATSDEDKGVRVLRLDGDGTMHTFSERSLPKRPSSVTFTPDERDILCSDKFGDVYQFGLLSVPEQARSNDGALGSEVAPRPPEQDPKQAAFKPAASESTVHTKKNLHSLQNQRHQAARADSNENNGRKNKAANHHTPILGHVSMLTDIVCSTVESETGTRSYIMTSDRDEHIRVSRGIPQAHIIEGFCLEHRQFVSRLCVPKWAPGLLISGGGDDYLFAWDWLASTCLAKWPIRNVVESALGKLPFFAVSGIWALSLPEERGAVIVALEGVPALCAIQTNERGAVLDTQVIELASNVLDVTMITDEAAMLWTVDCIHQKGSTKETRDDPDEVYLGMHRWNASSNRWEEVGRNESPLAGLQSWINQNKHEESLATGDPKKWRELYYTIEHLRKFQGDDVEEA